MISAGSAVSDSRTAPSTDCSASRFCGGATGPSGMRGTAVRPLPLVCVRSGVLIGAADPRIGRLRTYVPMAMIIAATSGRFGGRSAWAVRNSDGRSRRPPATRARRGCAYFCSTTMVLTVAVTPVVDLDDDHAGADGLDRLVEVDVAAVDRDAARLLDRVDDVLRGDRAEQAAVVAGLVGDREDRLVEQRGVLLRAGGRVGHRALGGDGAALGRPRSSPSSPARPACAGSGSCAGSPSRRRRRCPWRRASRGPRAGWPGASA